jgi:phosphoglycolate phosphatase-like HAD superfamily hydrolase
MITLFWDIDGTLITTGKAGVPAWEQAVKDTTGRDFELSSIRIAGMTDFQIAVRTFELLGLDADEGALRALVSRYEALLPVTLPQRTGRAMPNVREILDHLRDDAGVRSYLLTGNTRGGAAAKLSFYDLWHYFPDGGFAEDTGPRASIAVRALALARRTGRVDDGRVYVVGDTPHDVEAAEAIGARTIAVATGGYSIDELEAHRAWRVFAELPEPDEFARLIQLR